jgi:hypothetical protein
MSSFQQFAQPNVTGFEDLMKYNNYLTSSWYGVSIGVTVFFIVFLTLSFWRNEQRFVAASFTMLLVNLVLYAMQIVGGTTLTLSLVVFVSATLVMFYSHQ